MSKKMKLIPELRFPEFVNEGEWNIEPLGNLSKKITEKTSGRKYTLMSITSGLGLVTQIEKFGREIAGNSYKNYYVIRKGDFAYNKSSTKLFPEGEIAMLENVKQGAVPNSIFTCFCFYEEKINSTFAKYLFVNNHHGKWLRKFIAVGARAHGALQVNIKDLFSMPFPYPALAEQQKVASCLSSLDELIAAHSDKLESLKDHKKGLMQNLFPQKGQKVPNYRFPEFEDDGEWVEEKLGDLLELKNGINASKEQYGKGVKFVNVLDILKDEVITYDNIIGAVDVDDAILKKNSVTYGDILFQRSSETQEEVGTANVYLDKVKTATFGGFVIRGKKIGEYEPFFLNVLLKTNEIRNSISSKAGGSTRFNVGQETLSSTIIYLPSLSEQQKIASCLSALDELIITQTEKIEQLQQHKKGLMQGLFPNANK